jgi:hypothetical protein
VRRAVGLPIGLVGKAVPELILLVRGVTVMVEAADTRVSKR